MKIKVMMMVQLANAVAMLFLPSRVEEDMGAAVGALLEIMFQPSCSLILLDDGVTSLPFVLETVNPERAFPLGVTMFDMKTDTLDSNETLVELSLLVDQARQVRLGSWCVRVVVVSHDPAFLTAFAESSLKGRLLVWATRLLVVTRLSLPQLQAILPSHWTFSMMNTMFLNLENATAKLSYRLYTYLPYSLDGAQVVQVALWSAKGGIFFLTDLSLFPEKFSNFYGAKLNVTILPWPPYWEEEEVQDLNGTTVKKFSGSDYQAFKTTYEKLNFDFDIIPATSWDEVLGKMMERESFLVPVYYIIFPERVKRYDFTYIYEFSQATFSMAKPSIKPSWQSLYYPLTNQVWAAVFAVLLLIPVIFHLINAGSKEVDVTEILSDEMIVLEMAGILVGQNLPQRLPSASSIRLLAASWVVFAFIIGTVYRGNLIAALTLPKYPPRPETVEQMVDAVDSATMPPFGEDWLTFFAASESEVYKKLARLMVIGPEAKEGLQKAKEENTAPIHVRRYMANMIAEDFTEADGSTSLYVAQESIFPGPSGWPIPHDAPYKPQLDQCLTSIIEGGLYDKWSEDLLRETRWKSQLRQREYLAQQQQLELKPEDGEKRRPGNSIMALTLTHMQGPLMLLLISLAAAGTIFSIEVIAKRCKKST